VAGASGPGQGVNGRLQAPLGGGGAGLERKAEQMILEEMRRVVGPVPGEGDSGSDSEGESPQDPKGYEMGLVWAQARDEHSALTSALTFLSQSQSHLSRVAPPTLEEEGARGRGSGSDSEAMGSLRRGPRAQRQGMGRGVSGGREGETPSAFRWAQSLMSQLTSQVWTSSRGSRRGRRCVPERARHSDPL